jgi:tRNA threonylcarbamoyladenosine biosynthesis protein TsaB
MMLFLDTAHPQQTSLYLLDQKFLAAHIWESSRSQQETLHQEISKLLKKSKVKLSQISKIGVVVGPGFFSRVRSGVVTANTLAYALGVPVVGVRSDNNSEPDFQSILKMKGQKSVQVYYDKGPNITKPKKKK